MASSRRSEKKQGVKETQAIQFDKRHGQHILKQDVRDYADSLGVDEKEALNKGMAEMSETFKEKGAEIYHKV